MGKFLNYRLVLEETEPERLLYLAVPIEAYDSFFYRDLPKASIKKYQIKLIVYDSRNEVIIKWIN
ncbi:element excision factor XisH family protein [Nostoc sp. TCL26-01]|uniref:element excision factor XisH family protein n=1 Tax=Nostoc sp. TCL26-01 TaxID=2576904 RepID=UPI0015BCCB77|nr:element excision factor XisH family protein [Nostoc sp. TCL26-01]QLE59268.1 XisH protein [Nostoc sp. TCL26-01]